LDDENHIHFTADVFVNMKSADILNMYTIGRVLGEGTNIFFQNKIIFIIFFIKVLLEKLMLLYIKYQVYIIINILKIIIVLLGLERAMKTIAKASLLKEDEKKLFAEMNILKKMDHPNIVKLFELF